MQFRELLQRAHAGEDVDEIVREMTSAGSIATTPLGIATEPINPGFGGVRKSKKKKRREEIEEAD
jgi:hypothetical protein